MPPPCLPHTSGQGSWDGGTFTAHAAGSETAHLRKEPERLFDTMGRWPRSPSPALAPQSSFLPVMQILVCQTCAESLVFSSLPHRRCSHFTRCHKVALPLDFQR